MLKYSVTLPNSFLKLVFYIQVALLIAFNMTVFAAQSDKPKAKHVIVAPVIMQQISERVEALGTARATESVSITSNITEKVTQIDFTDGQQVKAGDILAVLDQAEEQADLKRAQAFRSERRLALERLLKLKQRKLASPDAIDRTRLELEQAEASITALKTRISDRVIRAPFDGIVGLRYISVGALIQTGDLIATLDDTRQIKLDFSVPSIFLSELKAGLKVRARAAALNNKEYLGEVESMSSRVDPVTRSIQVRALLANADGKIIPGILMTVELLLNSRQALVIPEASILPLADRHYVMVRVNKNGKDTVEKRQIKIGLRIPGYVEVLEGLSVAEQVVTHGNNKIKAGDGLDVLAVDDGHTDIPSILKSQSLKSEKKIGQ